MQPRRRSSRGQHWSATNVCKQILRSTDAISDLGTVHGSDNIY